MKSWSSVYLPPIDSKFNFPLLSLRDSASESVLTLPLKDEYSMYVCGITPYDTTHLGHAATYLTFDLVNRYLRAMGKKVHFVENVTDIDDPLLERAARDDVDWRELALLQIELFRGDMSELHIIPPEYYVGAVEAIPLVIKAVSDLSEHGTVYSVDGDQYFSVRSDVKFGSRAHLPQETMLEIFAQRGGDPQRAGKHDPLDPLLWMLQRPGEPGWASPFGVGRPGWHIECCAIALTYLPMDEDDDYLIDIQGGGSDLLFPHHEMGAAQARILGGKDYARVYLHTGMVGLNGEKMSKSLGNLVFLSTLVIDGADPMAIRIALLSKRYSADREWASADLDESQALLDRLRLLLSRPEVAPTDLVIQDIIDSLSQDLDTPHVFKAITRWCDETETGSLGGSPGELARAMDLLLGIAI
ncbi:MAG TPA: cysteine--1-D-myo-inosityl 2-amino-2-deoxy-alpha-D-glucopyranoside ligase [Candidatus Nanopelagicaceae bacterium]